MTDKQEECLTCKSPKLPNSEYCEGCQSKIDSYEPDEKIEEPESLKKMDLGKCAQCQNLVPIDYIKVCSDCVGNGGCYMCGVNKSVTGDTLILGSNKCTSCIDKLNNS